MNDAIKTLTAVQDSLMKFASLDEYSNTLHTLDGLAVEIDAAAIWRGLTNPLESLASMAGLSAEDAATVAGVTVGEIESDHPVGRRDLIERGLGRLALAMLARLRGELRGGTIGARFNTLDDPMEAAESFAVDLWNNKQVRRCQVRAAQPDRRINGESYCAARAA